MDYYSPAAITDETGTVTERYAFSAFGVRQILAPDFSPRSTSECGFEFAFQGQFEDVETGYLNYGYRYYVPWLGRWTCKDPIGIEGGVNLYGMVDNGVVNRVDFLGLVPRGELGPPPSEVSSDPTLNKVASDLLNTALAQPNSGYSGIEYCGLICVKCKKGSKPEYAYTGPYPGTTGDCDPFQGGTCKENFTDEWKLAGTYHTHPDSLPPSRPPGGQDTSYTNNVRVPTFVGGPKKDFWRHDPGTDKSTGKPNEPRTIPRLSH